MTDETQKIDTKFQKLSGKAKTRHSENKIATPAVRAV